MIPIIKRQLELPHIKEDDEVSEFLKISELLKIIDC